MGKASMPKIIQRFINLLWANSPTDWVIKNTYFQGTLFIVVSIPDQYRKIRRSFRIAKIHERSDDLWGLASDCIDEVKSAVTQR